MSYYFNQFIYLAHYNILVVFQVKIILQIEFNSNPLNCD